MAHQWIRCNLAAALFPFATMLWGRSIILPQYDQNYDRISAAYEPQKDRGVPQAFYMHNVFPTSQGYQSIGYRDKIAAFAGVGLRAFDLVYTLEYNNLPIPARVLFSPSGGKNRCLDATVGSTWFDSLEVFPVSSNYLVTTSLVNGDTYIFYAGIGPFSYDTVAKAIVAEIFTFDPGKVAADFQGICGANGYNVLWDSNEIFWSSAVDPTDFVANLDTGSGSGSVQYAKGEIRFCVPINGGFLIYCEKNVVSAKFTGNINFPWLFSEVSGSGGMGKTGGLQNISWQSNLSKQYALTTAGLQEITLETANNIVPEVTDFLGAKIYEDFNEATLQFSLEYLSEVVTTRVAAIADRWVVLSYGKADDVNKQFSLIFDTTLKRWGKTKIAHMDSFEFIAPNDYGVTSEPPTPASERIAYLEASGKVVSINFELSQGTANGVLMLGKFQFQRNEWITHQKSDVECVKDGNSFKFYTVLSLDGKTLLAPAEMYKLLDAELSKKYGARLDNSLQPTGQNISALFIGAFNLTSYLLDFTTAGDTSMQMVP